MRIRAASRPFVAMFRGAPVLAALFLAVTPEGRSVRGMAAQYPDGTRVVGMFQDAPKEAQQ